ncbi:unnamed protein product [Auanema sp. JU1783]|nr:unnamed protein product [Auanema sp. JU1783]
MADAEKNEKVIPSAPEPDNNSTEPSTIPSSAIVYPQVNISTQPAPPYPTATSGSSSMPSVPSTGYPGPPPLPSYQEAINFPTAAPYGQPPMNSTFPPKPYPNMGYHPQAPYPMGVQHPTQNIIHVREGPTPQSTVLVQVTTGNCRVCGGVFKRRLSFLYILCLIGLCIFAFPLALLFLCFLPCAYSYRCSNCGRTP